MSSPPGWMGNLEGLHELHSMILDCKSIIQTSKHRLTYFVCWGNLSQTKRFRGKASAVNMKNARHYTAGILLEKQQE
jgi:hypothetical protein